LALSIKLQMYLFYDSATLIIYLIDILEHMEKDAWIKVYTEWKVPNYTFVENIKYLELNNDKTAYKNGGILPDASGLHL
jgi:hypothetical protein